MFIGQTLSTVTFGPYLVRLSLEAEHQSVITLEGSYEQQGPAEEGWVDRAERLGDESRLQSSRLMQLTRYEVVGAAIEDRRSFRLEFANGQTLRLIDDSEQYESMQIHDADRLWIV